ncbi:unnamed protein product [Leptidea sinapis]|uniref:acid phosphatase n=1 Tax=Leptidea sinapis TaxID=189913 RepID=A0A5E4PRI9_9NEOP|nr:unnamed protein product [Leptidea sinapis]
MGIFYWYSILIAVGLCESLDSPADVGADSEVKNTEFDLNKTELLAAFVVFRHGDRTPDQEELDKLPLKELNNEKLFYPYGKKALTNKGKQRAFLVGKYLRDRYNGTISSLYLPNESHIQTTDYSRTKMTALTALAALFPPPPAQRWNPDLNWQPVPYDTPAYNVDNFLYYYNCPRYIQLRNKIYELPEFQKRLAPYERLFKNLSDKAQSNITTAEDVFDLDNLFQTLGNVGVLTPQWAVDVMPQIKEVTKIEYAAEFYTVELIRLASGVLMGDILNATNAIIDGSDKVPKLWLFSAHENNVAALMAASGVFYPHQPKYGSTISLEMRKDLVTGKYGVLTVYAAEAGGPGVILPIRGCGSKPLCDYDSFVSMTQEIRISMSDYKKECSIK